MPQKPCSVCNCFLPNSECFWIQADQALKNAGALHRSCLDKSVSIRQTLHVDTFVIVDSLLEQFSLPDCYTNKPFTMHFLKPLDLKK